MKRVLLIQLVFFILISALTASALTASASTLFSNHYLNAIYKQIPPETVYAYFTSEGLEYAVFKNNTLVFYRENVIMRNITLQGWIGAGVYNAFKGVRYAEHVFIPVTRSVNSTNYFYFIRYDYKRNITRYYLVQSSASEIYAVLDPYIGYDYLVFAVRFENKIYIHGFRVGSVLNNSSSKAFTYVINDSYSTSGSVFFDTEYAKPIIYTPYRFVFVEANNTIYDIDSVGVMDSPGYQIENTIYVYGYERDQAHWYYRLKKYTFTRFLDYGSAMIETVVHYQLESEYDIDFAFAFKPTRSSSRFIENVLIRFKNNHVFEVITPRRNLSQNVLTLSYHVNTPLFQSFELFRYVDSDFKEAFNTLFLKRVEGGQITTYALYFPIEREIRNIELEKGVYAYAEIAEALTHLPQNTYNIRGGFVFVKEAFENISVIPRAFNSIINIVKVRNEFKTDYIGFSIGDTPLINARNITRGFHKLTANYSTPFHYYRISVSYYKNDVKIEERVFESNLNEQIIPFDYDLVILNTASVQLNNKYC
jgi:hypothetical protein